VNDERRLIG